VNPALAGIQGKIDRINEIPAIAGMTSIRRWI
jgi:hypothetical protein